MKRLMISGFPCPPESWINFLGADTQVISFYDVLNATRSSDVVAWSRYIDSEIDRLDPESLVCHDYGGPMSLLALWRRQRKKKAQPRCVTILNTAFKDFDVFKNPHPFQIQILSWNRIVEMVEKSGGTADPRLETFLPQVKATYRRVIALSTLGKVASIVRANIDLKIELSSRIQIIASTNDPYIAKATMDHVARDFKVQLFRTINYGHFPYSSDRRHEVLESIHSFEKH